MTVCLSAVRNFEALHFQVALSQFVYSLFHFLSQIVKDELAMLIWRTAVGLPTASRMTFCFCYLLSFIFFFYFFNISITKSFANSSAVLIRFFYQNSFLQSQFSNQICWKVDYRQSLLLLFPNHQKAQSQILPH